MPKIKEDTRNKGVYSFKCPGCGDTHYIATTESNPENHNLRWGFNGNTEKPTFTPSLMVYSGHFVQGLPADYICPCKDPEVEEKFKTLCYRCHSFITDGYIQFLHDCSHHLAGKTVELPEILA